MSGELDITEGQARVTAGLRRINDAWLKGRPDELNDLVADGRGRDFWVFEQPASRWLAVWRTMLDVTEDAVP